MHAHTHIPEMFFKDLLLMLLAPSIFFPLQPSRMFTGMFETGMKTLTGNSTTPYR